jgi:hypothetical protein
MHKHLHEIPYVKGQADQLFGTKIFAKRTQAVNNEFPSSFEVFKHTSYMTSTTCKVSRMHEHTLVRLKHLLMKICI